MLQTDDVENLSDYFQTRTNERSNRAIALRIGEVPSTLNRQLMGATAIPVETVVQICRAYHLDMADAFVACGFITTEEAETFADSRALARISDLELAREIVRRLEAGEAGPELTEPIAAPDDVATITPLRRPDVAGVDQDLPEAAWESPIDHDGDHDDYHA